MFVIDKELLRPGVVYYPRGGPVSFSDGDLDEICRASKGLLASGRHPPIPLEHRDDAKPVKLSREDHLSEMTRHNTGWVQDFFRKGDGSLWARLGVIDPEVAEKIKDGRIRYVSPEITPVLPADGTVHRNVVTHVAITHQPVWAGQRPFHVPPGWVGEDGSVTPRGARLSLLGGEPIRLSLADAEPPDAVLEAIRFGYRIPGGKAAKGAWVPHEGKLAYFGGHVPKKVLEGLDDDEKRDLLRKLNARQSRHLPKDFAGLYEPGEVKEYPTEVQHVPAAHLAFHDELPPFRRAHPRGEPVLAWEDPTNGETHVVSGHDHLKRFGAAEGASVPVLRVRGKTPYEARCAALGYHLLSGSAHHDDLAQLLMDGADPKELRSALQESGHAPHEPLFHKAEYLAGLREDDPDATLADKPKQMSEADLAGPPEVAPPETLFSHAEGYDPGEHRWQHWLQGHFADAAERAAFAAAHGKERPATHDDFLARKDAFTKQRFSSGGDPVDYFEMTKPKDEDEPKEGGEPKGKGKEEKPDGKGDGPPAKKEGGDAPPAAKPAMSKFKNLLAKLEKFKVHLPEDKIKSAEDLVEQLETALHALEGAGAVDMSAEPPAGGPPGPAGGGGSLEPEQGSMFMSLKADNESLKAALLQEGEKNLVLEKTLTAMTFSMVEKDTESLQAKGQCTKARRDEWLGKIKDIAAQQRFSLLEPSKSVEMASVCAEIRMARSIPEGTFLAKGRQAAPAADPMALLFSNAAAPGGANGSGAPQRAGLVPEVNPGVVVPPPEGVPQDPEAQAQFADAWKNIRMSLGIKD